MHRLAVDIDTQAVQALCRRCRIAQLFVFGSVLRDDFGPESDVDFVVCPQPGARITFHELGDLETELSRLVGRPVDVVLRSELDGPDANPYRRSEILGSMESIYAF